MTAPNPQDTDPLFVQDEVAESIAVDLFRRYGRGAIGRDGRGTYDWRADAYLLVNRIRYLDGHSADGRGILLGLILAAISGAIAALIAVAVVSAAAPRSAAPTDIPAAGLVLTGTPSSGNLSLLPSGAPLGGLESPPAVANGGGAPLPTQDPGEIGSAIFGGTATWYCGNGSPCTAGYRPSDLVAAIDPSTGIGKGALLRVEHDGRSVEVLVVDVCACGGANVIDLTAAAFSRLAPLSTGRIDVAIEILGAEVTPPATDP